MPQIYKELMNFIVADENFLYNFFVDFRIFASYIIER